MKAPLARAVVSFAFAAVILPCARVGATVPPDIQVALLAKVFNYTKTLQRGHKLQVVVVSADASASLLVNLFRALEISAVQGSVADLRRSLKPSTVLYLGSDAAEAAGFAEHHGVLTVTGDEALVQRGAASIGVVARGKKSKILVNMERLAKEKHSLSAQLLRLAEFVD